MIPKKEILDFEDEYWFTISRLKEHGTKQADITKTLHQRYGEQALSLINKLASIKWKLRQNGETDFTEIDCLLEVCWFVIPGCSDHRYQQRTKYETRVKNYGKD